MYFLFGAGGPGFHIVTDISEETLQKTFRDAGMIGGYFRDAKDDLLSEYLVEFLKSYDESREFQPQKNRKRELKSKLEVNKPLPGLPSRRWRVGLEWKNTIDLIIDLIWPNSEFG